METLLTARLETLTPNVYPNFAPANYQMPCAAYQLIDTETMADLGEFYDERFVVIQIAVSATKYGEAKRLARAIRDNLKTWDDDQVQIISWIGESAGSDNSTQTGIHRLLMFFRFYVNE